LQSGWNSLTAHQAWAETDYCQKTEHNYLEANIVLGLTTATTRAEIAGLLGILIKACETNGSMDGTANG